MKSIVVHLLMLQLLLTGTAVPHSHAPTGATAVGAAQRGDESPNRHGSRPHVHVRGLHAHGHSHGRDAEHAHRQVCQTGKKTPPVAPLPLSPESGHDDDAVYVSECTLALSPESVRLPAVDSAWALTPWDLAGVDAGTPAPSNSAGTGPPMRSSVSPLLPHLLRI